MTAQMPGMNSYGLRPWEKDIRLALRDISNQNIIGRIWRKDWTIWGKNREEISNRLDWLSAPDEAKGLLPEISRLVEQVRTAGYTRAVVLGMGGSVLPAEVFSRVFKTVPGYLEVESLATTDPQAILNLQKKLSPRKTLFVASSKSGTTVETSSLLSFFFAWVRARLGNEESGAHFVAITDPGTPLSNLALKHGFRAVLTANPKIGGRFSVFSPFGLFPAALSGICLEAILRGAEETVGKSRNPRARDNPGVYLGTILAVLARAGRNKATLLLSRSLRGFAPWLEQLLAESTGKNGLGIVPVIEDDFATVECYGSDRFFIFFDKGNGKSRKGELKSVIEARFPVLSFSVPDCQSLGGQFFLWAMATAVAGFELGINPFDQPDVEASKMRAREFLESRAERRSRFREMPRLKAAASKDDLLAFLSSASPGDYIAILAFLEPKPQIIALLRRLQKRLRDRTRLAVTWGFGPQFLHTTGQLHKGDGGKGLFIQLTGEDIRDLPIPKGLEGPRSCLSFSDLKKAQARGDWAALKESGRRVLRVDLGRDHLGGLKKMIGFIRK